MTEEKLHELEKHYEATSSALDDLQAEHPTISFEPLRARLDAIGTILTAHAVELDTPDETIM